MRRLFQFVLAATVAVPFLFPLIEFFDRWDSTPMPSRDTELYILCLVVGVGIVFALRPLLRFLPPLLATYSQFVRHESPRKPAGSSTHLSVSLNASPPVPLRI